MCSSTTDFKNQLTLIKLSFCHSYLSYSPLCIALSITWPYYNMCKMLVFDDASKGCYSITFSISTVAYADIPSILPVKPSFSVVVALMEIFSSSVPITFARQDFMAGT